MLGQYGETLLLDWGLGKPFDKPGDSTDGNESPIKPRLVKNAFSRKEEVLGTPCYMSPEQAAAHHDLVGRATDVYGLGATLYCLLTGRAPFVERDLATVLRKVVLGDFVSAEELNPSVPLGLAGICKKAMALSPQHRYSTARALADDIERWLASEPTSLCKEAPTNPKGKKEDILPARPPSPAGLGQPGRSVHHLLAWVIGLLVVVSLAILATVSHNAQLRAMFGIFTWLVLGILALFLYIPGQVRLQAEKDRRTLAKFGLPKRPDIVSEWLLINIVVWPTLTLLRIAVNRARLDVGGIMQAWLILLPVTACVPLGRLLRWRRLARLQATLPSSAVPPERHMGGPT
jgi:hypothetical protein